MMGIIHAAKQYSVGMIHRITWLIRDDNDMFFG